MPVSQVEQVAVDKLRPHPGKRERLSTPKGIGSNLGNSETEGLAKSPVFAGFLRHGGAKNRETRLVGWGGRIRTYKFQNRGW